MIAGILAKLITGGLLDKLLEAYKLRQEGKISEAEFRSRVEIATQENAAKIEQTWATVAGDTVKAVQDTLGKSPTFQRAWSSVLFLQVTVLVWYQIGAPAFKVITGTPWPDPGVSLEWAYLLVGTQLGAGPLIFRK